MSTCLKTFTINVASATTTPFLWWPMQEAGSLDRIDTVQGVHLASTRISHGSVSSVPGKVNNSMQSLTVINSQGFGLNWQANSPTPPAWDGIEFDFWVKWVAWMDIAPKELQWILCDAFLDYTDPVFGASTLEFIVTYYQQNIQVFIDDTNTASPVSLNVPFVPVAGTWYFISAFQDVANGNFGLMINNGPASTGICPSAPAGSMDDLTFSILFLNGNPASTTPVTQGLIDEYAVFTSKLDAAYRDTVYNGGAGRTWP